MKKETLKQNPIVPRNTEKKKHKTKSANEEKHLKQKQGKIKAKR